MNVAYMLDTSVCVRVLRGKSAELQNWLVERADTSCLSTIVLHELHVGAEQSYRPAYNRDLVEDLAARLTRLPFDDAAARHSAEIRADLQKSGQLIGNNDLLIAGHARSLELKLVTGNLREFRRVAGLRCEDWL